MARNFSVTTGSVALVGATAKTAIEVATGAAVANEWYQLDVTFNGVTANAVPVTVEIVRYTATGTGTGYTPLKVGPAQDAVTAQSTVKINDTVEPSTPTIVAGYFIPPTSGITWQLPLGREIFSMTASQFMGIRLTAPVAVNYICNLFFEE